MKLLLKEDVAKELNCSTRTIQRYIDTKKIKAIKIGGKWSISQEEVEFIKQNGLR